MARRCEICGKGSQVGNQVTTRGKKKYLGGVGTKITGITRRQFKPNLQRVHVSAPDGTHKKDAGLHAMHSLRRGQKKLCVRRHSKCPRPKPNSLSDAPL